MKPLHKNTLKAFAVLLTILIIGCDNEGPAEKAGKQMDESVEQMQESLEIGKKGPMEKTGEAMDNAIENTGDKIENLGDKIEDKTDN